ncbi:MAG: class I SAM-dependent DNA methyltransferase [Kiloniellales bacterium]
MDFRHFNTRNYETLPVRQGYSAWAASYERTVLDLMDLRLLARLESVDWLSVRRAADLACGTGRVGVWLKSAGVGTLDGIDLTEAMLEQARDKRVYDRLLVGDLAATGFASGAYDLVTMGLADEHLADLGPLYAEAARLAAPGGRFVLVGYHPHFLMLGVVTHFDRAPGDPVAIESHVHLMSNHVRAAHAAGFRLTEMTEGMIDESWAAAKPKWFARYRHHPVSFAIVWRHTANAGC